MSKAPAKTDSQECKGQGHPRESHRAPASPEAPPLSILHEAGNLAIQRACNYQGSSVEIGSPHDPEEREAKRVSSAMRAGALVKPAAESSFGKVQRSDAGSNGSSPHSTHIRSAVDSPGRSLPEGTRAEMETAFGRDFSAVRLHEGPKAEHSAAAIQARAYTLGSHIVMGRGAPSFQSTEGRGLLAHELTHVVQQSGSATARPKIRRETASERVDRHTSYLNLDEDALGAELAGLLPGGAATVQEVLDYLSSNSDDVVNAILANVSDDTLRACGTPFIEVLKAKLSGGWTADSEYRSIGRLEHLIGGATGVTQEATTPPSLTGSPSDIISSFTSLANLDEDGLGAALASRAVADPALLASVLDALSSSDRDDVASAIVSNLSESDLARCDSGLLQRLRSELEGRDFSWTTEGEYQTMGHLDAAIKTQGVQQPLVGQAPATAITIEQFIAIIEREENGMPVADQTNTKLMITKLRKLFYGSQAWNDYLIPGAADVAPLYEFSEPEVKPRRSIEMPFLPNMLEYKTTLPSLAGAPADLQSPSKTQEVRMPDGTFVDIGHVLAGIDAINHPSAVDPVGPLGIESNIDAVTWVGDLGSALAEAVLKAVESERYVTDTEYQAIINEYASQQDMLGNIDAYVIGEDFAIDAETGGLKVSEILRQYYLGAHAGRDQRFTRFTATIGLGTLTGGAFANEEAWIEGHMDDVNDAAALYLYGATEGSVPALGTLFQKIPSALGLATNQGAEFLLIRFVQALKAQVAAEKKP